MNEFRDHLPQESLQNDLPDTCQFLVLIITRRLDFTRLNMHSLNAVVW